MKTLIFIGCVLCAFVYISSSEREAKYEFKPDKTATPWPKNEKCSKFQVKYGQKGAYKPVILVRDGLSNLVEKAIEESTGVFTRKGKLDKMTDPDKGTAILQKVSVYGGGGAYTEAKHTAEPRILVVRNPLAAILEKETAKLRRADLDNVKTAQEISKQLEADAKRLIARTKTWIPSYAPEIRFMMVQEKDLVKNPKQTLEQIHAFLNVPVDQERLECVVQHLQKKARAGRFDPRGILKKLGKNVGPAKKVLKTGVAELNQALAKYAKANKQEVQRIEMKD